MEIPNQEVIKNLKKGDQKTFENIFHTYYNRLFLFAKEYIIDVEIARELVQEVFLKLWEIRKKISDDTNLQSLLFTILRNNSLNYLKRVNVRKRFFEYNQKTFYELQLNYLALKDETSNQLLFKELQLRIKQAIEKLPHKCKEVFLLSRYEELKYKEIADKLKISEKTVENHIAEALKRIRKEIQDYI